MNMQTCAGQGWHKLTTCCAVLHFARPAIHGPVCCWCMFGLALQGGKSFTSIADFMSERFGVASMQESADKIMQVINTQVRELL